MAYDKNKSKRHDQLHSIRVTAGRSKTYFFDLHKNRENGLYLIINESTRRQNGDGYERHKIFVYKEDLLRFKEGIDGIVNHIIANGLEDLNAAQPPRKQAEEDFDDMHTDKEETDYRDTVSEPGAIHKMDEASPNDQDTGTSDTW